jgi:hypothetical protein
MSNIQHSGRVIVGGGPGHRAAMMAPMNSTKLAFAPAAHAPDRCTDRQRRLLKVKFIAMPGPVEPEPKRSWVSVLLGRVRGFLVAARR